MRTLETGLNSALSALPSRDRPLADRVIDDFVQETETKMMWVRRPTVHAPSVAVLKHHFATFNPHEPHAPVPWMAKSSLTLKIDDVANRVPELAGRFIVAEGKLTQPISQVAKYPNAISWAFMLGDALDASTMLVCRVPLPRDPGNPDYVTGDSIVAWGVVLADGAIRRLFPPGIERVVYMACTAVGRRPVPEDRDADIKARGKS